MIYRPPVTAPYWWLWLSCVLAMALIPTVGWIARSPRARRVVVALVIASACAARSASAAFYDFPDWCNPDWIPYMICWPW